MWSLVHDLLTHRHASDITNSLSDDEFKQQEELLSDGRNFFLNIVRICCAISIIKLKIMAVIVCTNI